MMEELTKKATLAAIALEQGRKRQSPFTHFLHLPEENRETIPLWENFSFVLALFRSRLAENILEGKELLERLLHFQVPFGSFRYRFPSFIHEYPLAKDSYFTLKLLPVLLQIFLDFSSLLGERLKQRLFVALKRLFLSLEKESFSFPHSFTAAAMRYIWQKIAGEEACNLMADLEAVQNHRGDLNSQEWGQILLAASFLPEEKSAPLFREAAALYHDSLRVFLGPCHHEPQEKFRPQRSFLDLMLGHTSLEEGSRISLHGALIKPQAAHASSSGMQTVSSQWGEWNVFRGEGYGFTVLKEKAATAPAKNAHIFRLFWQNGQSLVCQDLAHSLESRVKEDEVELVFTLPAAYTEGKEDYEIAFYLDGLGDAAFHVDGKRATTFTLGSSIQIKKGIAITLSFALIEGKGRFFGHLLKESRPAQIIKPTKSDFTVYDWKIALRTLGREGSCRILAKIKIQ